MTAAPPEQVAAGPLLLRRLRAEDAAAIAAAVAASMDHLRPWMPGATPDSADPRTQRVRVAESDEMWAQGTDFIYSIVGTDGALAGEIGLHRRLDDGDYSFLLLDPEETTLLGIFGLHRRIGPGAIELGYWLSREAVGRGLATAAAKALTTAALDLPDVDRVEIHCDEANSRSRKIPERLGYRLDRIEEDGVKAPGEVGRAMIWIFPA